MVKLLGVEFRRPSLTEIGVGGARDRLALLRALHDHVALELRERQQHVAQQRVDRVVGQDAEVEHVDGDALVDHLGDHAGRLRHGPRQPVEPCHDQHIAAPQLRPQPVPFRSVHLGAGERVRVDFFRARRRQRRLLRKLGFGVVPIILGVVLGDLVETNFRNSMVMSSNSLSIFVTRPFSLLFLALAVLSIGMFFYKAAKDRKKQKTE